MKLLLDTHTFIWWDSEPHRLSVAAKEAISNPENEVFLSVVSIWEMVIKSQLGKLSLDAPIAEIVKKQIQMGIFIMKVEMEHVLAVEKLLSYHKDPFDRLLIAQSFSSDWHLVTCDPKMLHYPISIFW